MKENATMKDVLHILQEQKLSVIQKEFNEMFPYLKLEFFRRRSDKPVSGGRSLPLNPDITLSQLSKPSDVKQMSITGDLKVKELESNFFDQFNLHIKVMRRSGRSWLETSLTNEWTLDFQNAQGKETSGYSE